MNDIGARMVRVRVMQVEGDGLEHEPKLRGVKGIVIGLAIAALLWWGIFCLWAAV